MDSERTSSHPASSQNRQSQSTTPIMLHRRKPKTARRHKQNVTRKRQHFSHVYTWAFLHMINRHGRLDSRISFSFFLFLHFSTLSGLFLGKQRRRRTCVKQLSQHVTQKQIQAKWISQVVATAAQSAPMECRCAEVPVSESVHRMAALATAWEDETCFSLSLLFHRTIKGSCAPWQTKRRWNCWKPEQVGWELNALSVGLNWKKCHYVPPWQHCCGIQMPAAANLDARQHGCYVSFIAPVNLWLHAFGYSLFVLPPFRNKKKRYRCLKLKTTGKGQVRGFL